MKIESKLGVNQYIFSEEELELIDDALSDARYTAMKEMSALDGYTNLQEYKNTEVYYEEYNNLLNEIRSKK